MVQTRDKLGIRWLGFVIMPEHVHLLVFPHAVGVDQPVPVSIILQHIKQNAGRKGEAALREIWRGRRTLGSRPLDAWALGDGPKPFWKTRGYDFNVTKLETLHEKLDYMHKSPITRGLANRADQWRWSSYRFYELGDDSVIAMDWDGSWPIV